MKSKWARTPLGKVIGKIDANTRAIAKLVSAQEYLHDYAKHEQVFEDLRFALVQERRNLKLEFEEEFARQQTRG